jgi:putative ABC transport system permease protein
VTLAGLLDRDGTVVRDVAVTPGVRVAEPGLTVEAQAAHAGRSIPLALSFVDPASRVWQPRATSGALGEGVLLAEKAAADLGVRPGDAVQVRVGAHTATLRVGGVHASPIRPLAYVEAGAAARFALAGRANTVALVPLPGTREGALERALFGRPGVGSVRPAAADAEALETTIASFRSAIEIVAVMTLGLALLVAFTSTSVALDERRREYATMQAFGLPPRTGLRVAMTESLVTGLAGTALGLAVGLAVAAWITRGLLPDTFPELSARLTLAPTSIATALAVGIVAVSAAPLLVLRRLRRMDIPATLRVME